MQHFIPFGLQKKDRLRGLGSYAAGEERNCLWLFR